MDISTFTQLYFGQFSLTINWQKALLLYSDHARLLLSDILPKSAIIILMSIISLEDEYEQQIKRECCCGKRPEFAIQSAGGITCGSKTESRTHQY